MNRQTFEKHVFQVIPAELGCLPDHKAIDCIQRMIPEGFPVHLAIHQVSLGEGRNRTIYSAPHTHQEWDEVNVLLSNSTLTYAITIGDEVSEVAAPATIWIPAGVAHAANVISGEGFFICLRIDKKPAATGSGSAGHPPASPA